LNLIKTISDILKTESYIINSSVHKANNRLKGEFTVKLPEMEEAIKFQLIVPPNYPLDKCVFTPDGIKYYSHQYISHAICLPKIKDDNPEKKFKEELKNIIVWIRKYYLTNSKDERYEYLLFERKCSSIIYFTDIEKTFDINEHGFFRYSYFPSTINTLEGQIRHQQPLMLLQCFIDATRKNKIFPKISYSKHYQKNGIKWGIWFYLGKEPVIKRRQVITNFNQLKEMLTESNLIFLNKFFSNKLSEKKNIWVMIGYPIPTISNTTENHWELLKISRCYFQPRIKNINKKTKIENFPLQWGNSMNMSYDRFFGRGKLSSKLIDKNIIIIGIGAIGSLLAEILVRVGAKKLTLIDPDIIQHGNICRSLYNFSDVILRKVSALSAHLYKISPFVEITTELSMPKLMPQQNGFEEKRKYLLQFDWIFDCSAESELAYMFDNMQLPTKVINFSISNQAKEFVGVVGGKGCYIVDTKSKIFKKLHSEPAHFYEGTGCFSSTFEASYVDIHLLLNYAMKNINYRLENDKIFATFIISAQKTKNGETIKLNWKEY